MKMAQIGENKKLLLKFWMKMAQLGEDKEF